MALKKDLTLVMIINENKKQVLLGMKKRGFGCGRWNGFGGKVIANESIEECAIRETFEECGLTIEIFNKIGIIIFEFDNDPVLLNVHVFRCDCYSGSITESDEMHPQWFNYSDIPFDQMWPDDYLWYPHLLKNEKFKGYFLFEGHDKILKEEVHLVDDI
ncbi:oxidized purine nucleoside triphosphate hydrolase [Hydra vulgaris]|uniref:Oxidized purine nucleoside triphosphate hydrolase n=1 Tax=Hydra vulgaris TaxID=6087 RepID=A0ABM4C8X5_HYDVU